MCFDFDVPMRRYGAQTRSKKISNVCACIKFTVINLFTSTIWLVNRLSQFPLKILRAQRHAGRVINKWTHCSAHSSSIWKCNGIFLSRVHLYGFRHFPQFWREKTVSTGSWKMVSYFLYIIYLFYLQSDFILIRIENDWLIGCQSRVFLILIFRKI